MRKVLNTFVLMLVFVFCAQGQKRSFGISVDAAIQNLNEGESIELVVHSSDENFAFDLNEHGIEYKQYLERYYRLNLRKSQVSAFYEMDQIDFIEPISAGPSALNDSMLSNNRVEVLHAGNAPLKKAYKGKGVILGFIDTGIDFSHPDFQDTSGNSRIIKIWEQAADTLVSSRIPRQNYGQVWDSSDINAGNCPHDDDILSHGTNVAGIASGNGNALNKYSGVAPESDIIMVASDFTSSNWLQTVADGVEFIFDQADALGKSCVVNISAGDYLGSHDGSDLAALRIDSMIKAKGGRAVVAACGNAGNRKFHLGYDVNNDTSFTWLEYNASSSLGYGAAYFQLWADTADLDSVQFSFGANLPSASFQMRDQTPFDNVSNRLGIIVTDSLFGDTNFLSVVQTYIQLVGDKYFMEVNFRQPDSSQYLYSFITTGTGHFDVWSDTWLGHSHIYDDTLPSISVLPEIQFYQKPDTFQTMVSSFTCLPSVITVGNYVNRNSYLDYNNTLQSFSVIAGKKADNSSLGPNRRGLQKPDVIASGDYTLTANRLASIPLHLANNQADRIASGGMHKRNGGTSMAAPVVSGIVALMMEECSNLDHSVIASRLVQNTYSDTLTGTLPNYAYGHGKVDAGASIVDLYFSSAISPAGLIQVCETDPVILNGPSDMDIYQWSTGDSTQEIVVETAGYFSLVVTDSNSCIGYKDSVEIQEWSNPPVPAITVIDDNTLESSTALSYLWYLDGYPMTNERSQRLTINVGGYYSVEIADANECESHSDSTRSFLNISEIHKEDKAYLFPNPSDEGIFNIECSKCDENETIQLIVRDMNAKLILDREVQLGGAFIIESKGMYQFQLLQKGQLITTGKLIYY